jgi:uncharacterized protein
MSPHPVHDSFCWLDLAASDATQARAFYARVFGWTAVDQAANGGHFTRLRCGGRDAGSLYQLGQGQLDAAVRSHWTPYIAVADLDASLHRVVQAGGRVVVPPVAIEGMTVVALIEDAVGAQVGLWQAGLGHPGFELRGAAAADAEPAPAPSLQP